MPGDAGISASKGIKSFFRRTKRLVGTLVALFTNLIDILVIVPYHRYNQLQLSLRIVSLCFVILIFF